MELSSFILVQPNSADLGRYSVAPGPPITYCESSSRFDYLALAATSSARSLHLSVDLDDFHRSSFCTTATVGAYDISR